MEEEEEGIWPSAPARMAVREGVLEEEVEDVGRRPGPSLMAEVEAMEMMSPGRTTVIFGFEAVLSLSMWYTGHCYQW